MVSVIILKIEVSPRQANSQWELKFSNPEKGPKSDESNPRYQKAWLRACKIK